MLSSVSINQFKRIGHSALTLVNLSRINYLVGENNSGKSSFLYRLFVEGISNRSNVLEWQSKQAISTEYQSPNADLITNNQDGNKQNLIDTKNLQSEYLEKITDDILWELVDKDELSGSVIEYIPSNPYLAGYASYSGQILLKVVQELNLAGDGKGEVFTHNHLSKPEVAEQIFWYLAKTYHYFELSLVKYFAGKFVDGRIGGQPVWGGLNNNQFQDSIVYQIGGQSHISSLKWVLDTVCDGKKLGYDLDCFIFEEPETNLHPDLQKEIPKILQEYASKSSLQFFVSTHSPFVITSAGEIVEQEKDRQQASKNSFNPEQKVYLIKNGQTASKTGLVGLAKNGFVLGSDGYWGRKIGFVAAKMVGMGLGEFVSDAESRASIDAPIMVFCEGEGAQQDAQIYNTIFWNYHPRVLFVSSKGSSQTAWSFDILEQVKKGMYANFNLLMLRDRDHDFPTWEDIQNYKRQYPQRRVLYRRAIECYLYSPETAMLWLEQYGLQAPFKVLINLEKIQKQIAYGVENGQTGDGYKEKLVNAFEDVYTFRAKRMSKHKYGPIPAVDPLSKKLELARLITKKTETYKELVSVIFGKIG